MSEDPTRYEGGQPTTPYLDAVVARGLRGSTRFHVPGHKGGEGADPGLVGAIGERALLLDLSQGQEGIDIGPSPTPFESAERLAAEFHGAQRTFFLTNGASQGNHALCLALAPHGTKVAVQRNAHASVIDGLVLSGGTPVWVAPEYDEEMGMAHGVTPAALEGALEANPEISTVFVVSPTYYGSCADVPALAAVAHSHGAALVVDQSWGAHFGAHPDVPASAIASGADAVLTSTHKTVGSLTQSAMLHVSPGDRIDLGRVARCVRIVRSTSASCLLHASLDAARRQLAVHGEALLDRTLTAASALRARIDAIPGCRVVGDFSQGSNGSMEWDPLRISIDVRGTGRTGFELAQDLRELHDTHVELKTQATLVLVLGIAQPVEQMERFSLDLAGVVRRGEPSSTAVGAIVRPPEVLQQGTSVTPREAFLGVGEAVPVDLAVGRVSCETIAGYPPGIPALLPGEVITDELVGYLRAILESGAQLHGASDPEFTSIVVMAGDGS
ncbi:MAG: aminotransferase class I/II-fold pyridoxal phosphate-dependent enzyme [Actinomycetes bacterium]